MSPEQDAKLFQSSVFVNTAYSDTGWDKLCKIWATIPGPTWTPTTNLLPAHLDQHQRLIAQGEIKAIDEFFYSTTKLPIITPDNVSIFMDRIKPSDSEPFVLWSWCCGSARLLLTMTGLPFCEKVLFPVDLRYGWDVNHPAHRKLLLQTDILYQPLVTTIEPRCKHWSRSGNRRDPAKTRELRLQEQPMLEFLARHARSLLRERRHLLIENPRTSALWTDSPIAALVGFDRFADFSCDISQCAFSPSPDGERHKKQTRLLSSFLLTKTNQQCRCRLGHLQLQGYDPVERKQRTAAAALFPRKLCTAICADVYALRLSLKPTKSERRQRHYVATTPQPPTVLTQRTRNEGALGSVSQTCQGSDPDGPIVLATGDELDRESMILHSSLPNVPTPPSR